jgi:carotenoid cleavage dioxygenase-like enzyme
MTAKVSRGVRSAHPGFERSRGGARAVDHESGERTFERAGFIFGEPLFVARPEADGESDGAVLAVGSHVREARSAMVVLDAESFDLRAWAEVPLPIPLGFHGSFFRA